MIYCLIHVFIFEFQGFILLADLALSRVLKYHSPVFSLECPLPTRRFSDCHSGSSWSDAFIKAARSQGRQERHSVAGQLHPRL